MSSRGFGGKIQEALLGFGALVFGVWALFCRLFQTE